MRQPRRFHPAVWRWGAGAGSIIALLQIGAYILASYLPGSDVRNLLALSVAVVILALVSMAGFNAARQTGLVRSGTFAGCIALELGAIPFVCSVEFLLLLAGTLEYQSARPQAYDLLVLSVVVLAPVLVGLVGGLFGRRRYTAPLPNSLAPGAAPGGVAAPTTRAAPDA